MTQQTKEKKLWVSADVSRNNILSEKYMYIKSSMGIHKIMDYDLIIDFEEDIIKSTDEAQK